LKTVDVIRRKITVDIYMCHLFTAQFFYGYPDAYYGYPTENAYGYNEAITKQGRISINVM
jgi:hypothetical protein